MPLLSGIYSDANGDIRTAYPRNLLPTVKNSGINDGYFRPAHGISLETNLAGEDKGGIFWPGHGHFRVIGNSFCQCDFGSAPSVIHDMTPEIGGGYYARATFSYGHDRLAIWYGAALFYYIPGSPSTFVQVTDGDLGIVHCGVWADGYYLSTDGRYIITTDIDDPMSVSVTKYGSAESDPDGIVGLGRLRNEVYAFGTSTIEVLENVGGAGFPWARVESAQVQKGVLGSPGERTFIEYMGTWAFVGGGRNEPPAVYLMSPGDAQKISTDEIDAEMLAQSFVELDVLADGDYRLLLVHVGLKTYVYDHTASLAMKTLVWSVLDSTNEDGAVPWPLRSLVYANGSCVGGSRIGGNRLGRLTREHSNHFGSTVTWELSTPVLYNGVGAIVGSVELVSLTGRTKAGVEPAIWTSYSHDGETWSQEKGITVGARGERSKRLQWRNQGMLRNWRIQRIRGTSDAHLSPIRLEMEVEELHA